MKHNSLGQTSFSFVFSFFTSSSSSSSFSLQLAPNSCNVSQWILFALVIHLQWNQKTCNHSEHACKHCSIFFTSGDFFLSGSSSSSRKTEHLTLMKMAQVPFNWRRLLFSHASNAFPSLTSKVNVDILWHFIDHWHPVTHTTWQHHTRHLNTFHTRSRSFFCHFLARDYFQVPPLYSPL